MKGIVFDIKEFALNDGGGIRTTIFLKGCPLRCIWCHNPEGLSANPELSVKQNRCVSCGLCHRQCEHEECQPYGRCLHICPNDLIHVVGQEWESEALAERLLRQENFFRMTGGGVTLSGGEPLLQAEFCIALLSSLRPRIHCAIETSGYASSETFEAVVSQCDFVYMDLKLADREAHLEYTGVSNDKILRNAAILKESGIPHKFRIPLIPNITDTLENLSALSEIIGEDSVELLPYNTMAAAKYKNVGRIFSDRIDPEIKNVPDLSLFRNATLRK